MALNPIEIIMPGNTIFASKNDDSGMFYQVNIYNELTLEIQNKKIIFLTYIK